MQMGKSANKLTFDRGMLYWDGPREQRPPGEKANWNWNQKVKSWECDPHHYPSIMQEANRDELLDDAASFMVSPNLQWKERKVLRAKQEEGLNAWLESKRGLVVLPTGLGKTQVAMEAIQRLNVPVLIVVPVRPLMYQWADTLKEAFGIEAGLVGDRLLSIKPVTVTTYASACIKAETLGDKFQLLVFDECHHLPGQVRSDAARMSLAPYRLGLTATPHDTAERRELTRELIGPTAYRVPLREAAGDELAEYEITRLAVPLTEDERNRYQACGKQVASYVAERRRENPDFSWNEVRAEEAGNLDARRANAAHLARKKIVDEAAAKMDVLEDIFRIYAEGGVIVFTGTNRMARAVSKRYWIPCFLEHCPKDERQDILEGFGSNRYRAVVANRMMNEGINVPNAKVAVVLGGRSSKRDAEQRLGRLLREWKNRGALLYEVVCENTHEEAVSRKRRNSDAYQGTLHRKI